jgi:enolase
MSPSDIKKIRARQILDSRGNPTVEVEVETDSGTSAASVPSGASTGKHEAVELRDGGKAYAGKGVLKAVDNINNIIAPKLLGMKAAAQGKIDGLMKEMDGTENKANLGGNAICAVSLAVCRAASQAEKLPLFKYVNGIIGDYKLPVVSPKVPIPSFNIINGGAHAGNRLDFQEFMIAPQKQSFAENLRIGAETYQRLKRILLERYGKLATNLGDEGGFAPPLIVPEQALELISSAVKSLGYESDVRVILDVAASQFLKQDKYKLQTGVFTREGLLRYYGSLVAKYPILGIEDPFGEEDWEGFQNITSELGGKIMVIGDDLLVTNPARIKLAKEKKAANAMILKINQIGTVSDSLEAARLAREYGWRIVVSHRSGDTTDDFIADFAVGIAADFIKTGAPARGERVAKYNRLAAIEELLS